jgi:hypothetical protein
MDAECRRRAAVVRQVTGWTALGNSDAHQVEKLAFCYTVFEYAIRDQRDLIEAIRSGKATPRERVSDRL